MTLVLARVSKDAHIGEGLRLTSDLRHLDQDCGSGAIEGEIESQTAWDLHDVRPKKFQLTARRLTVSKGPVALRKAEVWRHDPRDFSALSRLDASFGTSRRVSSNFRRQSDAHLSSSLAMPATEFHEWQLGRSPSSINNKTTSNTRLIVLPMFPQDTH